MFITALFTITELWKQSRCPTTDEWVKKIWCLYTMEFYSATKKNENEDGTGEHHLNEAIQVQKAKIHMFSLVCVIQTSYKYYGKTGHTKGKSQSREEGYKKEVRKVNKVDIVSIQE
jgi:meiotically up-regulated gene 157 (Mug157) protein